MIIGGMQKFSLVDFPGKTSAVFFSSGCNMRCGYCHNPELVLPNLFEPAINMDEIYNFLDNRIGKLDGIVLSGGEPSIHKDMSEFLGEIKHRGFAVKLDSNGTNPQLLMDVIENNLVDYFAMDIKAPLDRYSEVTGRPIDTSAIERSVDIIMGSGIDYEFRTTVMKGQLDINDFVEIGSLIKGADKHFLQKFSPCKTLDPGFMDNESYSDAEMQGFQETMNNFVHSCLVR
ncbi:MAG: anaerobic ribonucleoside-triphosphate reductase activating protein [Acidimicrobiia bacterium]|nr:anaerobic ribonucleoside-triphosphate reductase activating protein [Acidimicrobiia bacterium]